VLTITLSLQLRVAQVTNGTNSKLGKVKMVRKNIARVLTVINNKARDSFRSQLKKEGVTNERKPKQLRVKKTRAIRRALTKVQVRGGTCTGGRARPRPGCGPARTPGQPGTAPVCV